MRIEWLFMCVRVAEELNEEQIHISEKGAMHRSKYNLCVQQRRRKTIQPKNALMSLCESLFGYDLDFFFGILDGELMVCSIFVATFMMLQFFSPIV